MRRLVVIIVSAALTLWVVGLLRPAIQQAPKTAGASSPAVPPLEVPKANSGSLSSKSVSAASVSGAMNDPQFGLSSAVEDIISIQSSGDLLYLFEKYTPPAKLAQMTPEQRLAEEQQRRDIMADPDGQERTRRVARMYLSMQGQTPEMNEAGDVATYYQDVSEGPGMPTRRAKLMSLVKIDGKWYIGNKP